MAYCIVRAMDGNSTSLLVGASTHPRIELNCFPLSFQVTPYASSGTAKLQNGSQERMKVLKRLFDILLSSAGLILLIVPFGIIALAIKFNSRGPIFYRQQRIGYAGRPFWLYKFRSMLAEEAGPHITVEGDPRVTQVGSVLRRWKLDELPQLWNVLRGEMSVIGPRPEVEQFLHYYSPEQRLLLEQTPGLAGMSQLVYPHEKDILQGHPNPEEAYLQLLMPRKLAIDLQYEQTRTFWSDLWLFAEIVLLILGKSYRADRDFHISSAENSSFKVLDKF